MNQTMVAGQFSLDKASSILMHSETYRKAVIAVRQAHLLRFSIFIF
jgi:hypothetical protein